MLSVFRNPASMEPLMPSGGKERLSELTAAIFRKSGELRCQIPSELVREEIARLVQAMNSYYSNLIEGHKTSPRDIEKALRQEFSSSSDTRRNQLLSLAHIETEQAMRLRLAKEPDLDILDASFVSWLHETFYGHLPESERVSLSHSGQSFPITPGALRDHNVDIGRHTPPDYPAVPSFLQRFHSGYGDKAILATDRLVATAAAHHRLAWIHPFGDGNGRVARLHSQAALIRAKVDCDGLWTLSCGLARKRQQYYQQLALADSPRLSDLDGRGNLSDAALSGFCVYFLEVMFDQIVFMSDMLSPVALADRIEQHVRFQLTAVSTQNRERIAKLLRALLVEGELPRGAVQTLFGLKSTVSREIIQTCFTHDLVCSPSPKGPLRLAFNSKVLETYFPKLFSDISTD